MGPSADATRAVRGVDFPRVGVRAAHNDMRARTFEAVTAPTSPDPGATTTVTVDRLPDPATVSVTVDEQPHGAWRTTGPDSISVDLPLVACRLRVTF